MLKFSSRSFNWVDEPWREFLLFRLVYFSEQPGKRNFNQEMSERQKKENSRSQNCATFANTSSYSQEAVTFKESLKLYSFYSLRILYCAFEWDLFHRTPLYRVTQKSTVLYLFRQTISLSLSLPLSLTVGLSKIKKYEF